MTPSATLSAQQKENFVRDGYFIALGLLPQELVKTTRENLLAKLEIDPHDASTWDCKQVSGDLDTIALTESCRTPEIESIAQQLVLAFFRVCLTVPTWSRKELNRRYERVT